jgi:uncharacterized protein involved in outer membrane biogenesis
MHTTRGRGILLTLIVVAVAAGALYAAAGFLLAPRLIERQLSTLADQRLGQKMSMEKVKVNPFALSIEITGLRLAQANKPALLAAKRVYLDLALLSSGFGRGWVLSEVQTEGLQVLLEAQANGRLNLADVLQRWQKSSPPSNSKTAAAVPPRFTIKHLLASDGMLTYRELSDRPAATQILPIRIELENVSTLPDHEGRYTVSARFVDGGALTWRGDLALQPLQSEGDVELKALKLATAWQFIRDQIRLGEPRGTIDLATHYRFSYANSKLALALSKLRADASGVSVAREGNSEPLVSLKTLEVRDGTFDLGRRSLVLPAVSLSNGRLGVLKNTEGVLNWSGLARDTVAASPTAREPGKSKQPPAGYIEPWNIEVRELKVQGVALRFTDRQRNAPLDLQTGAMQGHAALTVVAGETLDVRARDMELRLEKLRLPADAPTVQLTQVQLHGGYLDLSKKEFGAKELTADGGTLQVERAADGTLPIAKMLEGSGEAPASQTPWKYAVALIRLQHLDAALSDRSFGQTIAYVVSGISARLDNFASSGNKAMEFKAAAQMGNSGSLIASGTVAPNFSRADAKVKVSAVELVPLQPVVAHYAAVDLASGSASASVTVTYKRVDGKPSLSAVGPFALENVRLNEAGSDARVLAWKRLSSREARVMLGPDRALIKEIVIESPEMRFDVSEQREISLAQLFNKQQPAAADPQRAQNAEQQAPFPIRIGELRVRDGTIDYSDRSLALPFAIVVTNFEGTAAGLGTDRDRIATLQFEGEIGEFGSAQIEGRIDAFSPTTLTDIAASFENVDMPELSPYTVTFLGRKIASGKLWVEMKYRIENGTLTGGNDVTVHDLALGEAVDTPTALKLPLDLAVALLTDSDGVIHTAIPVTGNLHDPKFDVALVIREALASLVKKIVTAPFRALAGLFGGDKQGKDAKQGKDFGGIEFEPGSAKLMASEKEKLQNVAKAMDERPQLKLIVQAPYSADTDGEAMRQELARREVALALGRSLQPEEKPGLVVFENLATQRALERLAARKSDPSAMREWVAKYTKKKGKDPKRAGMILRTAGDPDFYEAMFDWLAGSEAVSATTVKELATNRAKAVIEALRASGVDADRIEIGPVKSVGQQKENISAELSLAPAGVHGSAAVRSRRALAAQDR